MRHFESRMFFIEMLSQNCETKAYFWGSSNSKYRTQVYFLDLFSFRDSQTNVIYLVCILWSKKNKLWETFIVFNEICNHLQNLYVEKPSEFQLDMKCWRAYFMHCTVGSKRKRRSHQVTKAVHEIWRGCVILVMDA